MKNLILILVFSLFVAPSCKRKTIEQLNQKNQELSKLAGERDSIINQLSSSVEDFEGTLGIFDNKGDLKDRMQQSIENLKEILEENDKKQKLLQRMVAGSGIEKARLSDEIDSLNIQLNAKENQLAALNKDVFNLKMEIDTQQFRINGLVSMSIDQNDKIETLTSKMNTGNFVVGNSKELLNKDVIVKKGGFLNLFGRVKKLNPQFNRNEFSSIDIYSDTLIELTGDKVNIVTVHPSDTYILTDTNNVKQLEIVDPEKFWEASKYLVVENQ